MSIKKATKTTKPKKTISRSEVALAAIRDAMHENCKDLTTIEYREVLDVMQADLAGNLETLDEEESGED